LRGELLASGAEEILLGADSIAVWSVATRESSEPDLRGELLASGADNNLTRSKLSSGLERSDMKKRLRLVFRSRHQAPETSGAKVHQPKLIAPR
jgi:hypothetical protein